MVEQGSGYVINIVSSGGVSDPHPYCTSYACSKTGLMRLTEGLAAETAEHGVKVFAVGPPAIDTQMTNFIRHDADAQRWRPGFETIFEEGRDVPPELVADFLLELVSGRADALSGRYFDPKIDLDQIIAQSEQIVDQDLWTLRIRRP